MIRVCLHTGLAVLLSASALAQSDASVDVYSIPHVTVVDGVYHVATQTLEMNGGSTSMPVNTQVIYNNTCPTPYFASALNGTTWVDDGRIPTSNSPVPNNGTLNNYRVNKFQIGYCTRDLAGVFSIRVRFWQSLLQNTTTCTSLAGAGVPTADFTLTGVPGAPTVGTLTCYILDIDLTGGFEFCMQGDADGSFNADAFQDGFGWGATLLGQTGADVPSTGGFIMAGVIPPGAGTAVPCPVGEGTYYNTPGAVTATGLGNDLTVWREGMGGQSTVCTTFGSGRQGFHLKIWADVDDCTTCPGNPNADGDGAPDCIDGCPDDPNKIAPGQCGCGTPDDDSDSDGTADCNDICPHDAGQATCGFCFCDSISPAQSPPCNNGGDVGHGCKNSKTGSTGALLTSTGGVSVATNDLVLTTSGMMAGSFSVFLQGTRQVNSGMGGLSSAYDGLACVEGSLVRLGRFGTLNGSNSVGNIASLGAIPPAGGTFHYQTVYRNQVLFCTPATLNTSNAVAVHWQP